MAEPSERTAVLLLGFGGPESIEQVRPFIESVVRGKNVPSERVDTVVGQYRQIGGRSPYNALTMELADALASELARTTGSRLEVFVGMLHCQPYIADAVRRIAGQGIRHLVVVVLAPHRTEASFEKYIECFQRACDAVPEAREIAVDVVESWHTQSGFVEAIADRVCDQLAKIPGSDLPKKTSLIFTAHSVPTEMSDKSGYARQIEETARAVVDDMERRNSSRERLSGWVPWHERYSVGYQSRSGAPGQEWLEPDIAVRLSQAKQRGADHAVVVPIGFLVDHVEVLFDLDVLAAGAAKELGMNMLRAKTVGCHEKFVSMLASLVRNNLESRYAKPERL